MSDKPTLETKFEQGLFASRWLMAPMYLGLVVSLGMMAVIFIKELAYYVPKTFTLTADQDGDRPGRCRVQHRQPGFDPRQGLREVVEAAAGGAEFVAVFVVVLTHPA